LNRRKRQIANDTPCSAKNHNGRCVFFMSQSSGEEFLIENGVFNRRSATQRQVIACLACRWSACETTGNTPIVYGKQIIECSGLMSGTISPILQRIKKSGAIVSEQEARGPQTARRPVRVHFRPADSELGTAFANSLDTPAVCNLEGTAPSPENQTVVLQKIIATSSRAQLELIIAQATERIHQLDTPG